MKAYCWRSGLIELGSSIPSGAIPILDKHGKQFSRERVEAGARHGYDGSLLVPGIPEAESAEDAMTALEKWIDWLTDPRAYGLKMRAGE